MTIKLVNLNLWFGGLHTWNSILEYLEKEKPDLLTLQEVQNSNEPTAPIHLRSYRTLRQILQYPYSEFEASMILHREDETAPFGNAIFSRFPLSSKSILWLQGNEATLADSNQRHLIPSFPRNLLHCKTTINDRDYNLMSLQGVWAHDATETPAQIEMGNRISKYVQGKNNVILAGDFNVNEGTQTIDLLGESLSNIFKGERRTSFNMTRKGPQFSEAVVDFVFTSPNIKVADHHTATADVSDHQSQIVVLEL